MKLFILFLFLLCCSGCKADYSVTIKDDQFYEDVKIYSTDEMESTIISHDSMPITAFYDAPQTGESTTKIPGVSYLDKKLFQENNLFHMNLTYNYQYHNFSKAASIHSCFQSFYMDLDESMNLVYIKSSDKFMCFENYPYLDELVLHIVIDYPVESYNADKVNGNEYIWYINRSNYQNRPLEMVYRHEISSDNTEVQEKPVSPLLVLTILGGFVVFLIVIFLYNYKQQNRYEKY